MGPNYSPFIIQIELRAPVEDCPDVIPVIRRKLMRSAFEGKDGPTRLTFVKDETGTARNIAEKYQEIEDHPDVIRLRIMGTCAQNYSSAGVDDSLVAKINENWRKRRKRNKPQDVPDPNRLFVEQVKGASRQSVMRPGRAGKPSQKPNKRELHAAAHNLFKPTLIGRD